MRAKGRETMALVGDLMMVVVGLGLIDRDRRVVASSIAGRVAAGLLVLVVAAVLATMAIAGFGTRSRSGRCRPPGVAG